MVLLSFALFQDVLHGFAVRNYFILDKEDSLKQHSTETPANMKLQCFQPFLERDTPVSAFFYSIYLLLSFPSFFPFLISQDCPYNSLLTILSSTEYLLNSLPNTSYVFSIRSVRERNFGRHFSLKAEATQSQCIPCENECWFKDCYSAFAPDTSNNIQFLSISVLLRYCFHISMDKTLKFLLTLSQKIALEF